MKKKLLGILLSTAMIATMLVGCGSSAADTTAPADSSRMVHMLRMQILTFVQMQVQMQKHLQHQEI